MSEEQLLVLYDLASSPPCRCWSPNTWKVRFMLNYKQIPYKTVWIEYPEISPLLESHVSPNADSPMYTIPAALFPDGQWMMDSFKIVDRIQEIYPSPPLDMVSWLTEMRKVAAPAFQAIAPNWIAKVPKNLLNPSSQDFFYRTRAKDFGMPLDQFEGQKGGDHLFQVAAPHIKQIAGWYRQDTSGPFLNGPDPCYADLLWIGLLNFMRCIDEDVLTKWLAADPEPHQRLLRASRPYLQRDTH